MSRHSDERDREAARTLLDWLQRRGHPLTVYPRSRGELAAHGIDLPADAVEVPATATERPIIVCVLFTGELMLPDNHVELCAGMCCRLIQRRPWIPENSDRMCAECALRQARGDA